jgi:hypothetical protein
MAPGENVSPQNGSSDFDYISQNSLWILENKTVIVISLNKCNILLGHKISTL